MYKFENLNQTLIGMCQELTRVGVAREVRGFSTVEIPYPVMIEIANPTDRYITIPQRKWNKFLPWAESLWIALGLNDVDELPGKYCKGLHKYADNGKFWRAGYGPRIRSYTGLGTDICISNPLHRGVWSGFVRNIDQLEYVILALKRDINTRQAIIEIGDPVKDDFTYNMNNAYEIKQTVDYPCTRSVQFMMVDGALNCTVYIRSNDVLFGMSAVNITNFTLMQEYVANIMNVPVGKYYHVANNLHMYDNQRDTVNELAAMNVTDYASHHRVWMYQSHIPTLEKFDQMCIQLYNAEKLVYNGECDEFVSTGNDLFDDWTKVFLHHRTETSQPIPAFANPYLNDLFNVQ